MRGNMIRTSNAKGAQTALVVALGPRNDFNNRRDVVFGVKVVDTHDPGLFRNG